jgi:hypothetical protein
VLAERVGKGSYGEVRDLTPAAFCLFLSQAHWKLTASRGRAVSSCELRCSRAYGEARRSR